MSIATRITSIENHLSNDYTEIARLGADLTNVDKNIENIAETIREAYSKFPKVLGTGSNLSLSPTLKGGLDITPKGNCEQDTTSISDGDEYDSPTPDHPQPIRVVTGDNEVVVSNSDNTQSQTHTLHLGSNYLAGIGDYKDEIVGKTDEWKVVRKVGKKVYTGASSETWQTEVQYNINNYRIILSTAKGNDNNIGCLSTYFLGVSGNQSYNGNVTNAIGIGTSKSLRIRGTSFEDVSAFQTWLSTHNLIVYYQLATPIEETITDQTLIADLNNMYNLLGYDGQTNITISSNSANAQMTAQVKALKGE